MTVAFLLLRKKYLLHFLCRAYNFHQAGGKKTKGPFHLCKGWHFLAPWWVTGALIMLLPPVTHTQPWGALDCCCWPYWGATAWKCGRNWAMVGPVFWCCCFLFVVGFIVCWLLGSLFSLMMMWSVIPSFLVSTMVGSWLWFWCHFFAIYTTG